MKLHPVYKWFNEFESDCTNLTVDLHDGCSMTTTEDYIGAVRLVIETDKRDLSADLDKIRHRLTEAQKLRHVNWYCEMLQRFTGGDLNAVYNIATCDEIWIYCYNLETKRQYSEGVSFRGVVY
ncbi:hypothetical protein EVAR_78154_1 [Eumeta japonica]|uniref:Mariner Mos1 transposase n=1 Tax=Eumeta variegata TaxID=151549 RepID=A0A4C1UYN6_EUMVA|nr:hypothetical protein EVAR_78154_1 [Eumeta japonica]